MVNKNLPNIPLYIGDWEKDCNVLSLECEAAWLRIIFKMFTNGKQSSYKLPTKGLQNLWRVSEQKVDDILNELTDYNICEIVTDGRFTEFICRRYVKENTISEIRKKAVSKRSDRYKPSTKPLQNTENENESVNENEAKDEVVVEVKKSAISENLILPFTSENFKTEYENWKDYKLKEFKFKYKSIQSEKIFLNQLFEISNKDEITAISILKQSISNGWKGVFELKNNQQNGTTTATTNRNR